MADYFTSDHFKLLNKWRGQKRDESNSEQGRAYEDLKKAYEVTEAWARAVQARLFPQGRVEVRKRPTNQGNNFSGYTWAKIYPSTDPVEAPTELAYTVGIERAGFVVKIDTVGLAEDNPARQAYLALRGGQYDSPIVKVLPPDRGLELGFAALIDWTVQAIGTLGMSYADTVDRLGLRKPLDDEEVLKHFDGKPAFRTFRASWSAPERAIFCRLARAVHAAGLDWWHMSKDVQVRFGRKHPGSERAVSVFGIVRGTRGRTLTLPHDMGTLGKMKRVPLTESVAAQVEAALAEVAQDGTPLLPLDHQRPGLWPDQLKEESDEPGDESEDDSEQDSAPARQTQREPVNRIYYGPPGTGKTYKLSRLLESDYEQSVGSVPLDEWRATFITDRVADLTWWEAAAAALYDLGGRAKVAQLRDHAFVQALAAAKGRTKNVPQTLWGTLQHHAVENSATVNIKLRLAPAIFDKTADSVWHFAGDWQDAGAELREMVNELRKGPPEGARVKRYSFVTFHQSYGYEEFVEGLRPVLQDEGGSIAGSPEEAAAAVGYRIRAGAFKELCERARRAPEQRFAMVIDEINRGNISKIFGELITLIEADKRAGAENAVSVTLPYSQQPFSVPPNVDIIGTMNTADRSLALLDTALRRRFEFEPLLPDTRDQSGAPLAGLRVTFGDKEIHIPRLLAAMNQRIEALYDRDHCIGHAYFYRLTLVPDGEARQKALAQLFSNRILPLLEEYFFEDWQKVRLVLADNQKPQAMQFVIEGEEANASLERLFGTEAGLGDHDLRRRYVVQDAALWRPEAYQGIYLTLADN
jgi:5-methylcytosine-specific restriction protein B